MNKGLSLDLSNSNNGVFNTGGDTHVGNGISFGNNSVEGIASKRTPTGNQYGLDFYTGFRRRMYIDNQNTISVPGERVSQKRLEFQKIF